MTLNAKLEMGLVQQHTRPITPRCYGQVPVSVRNNEVTFAIHMCKMFPEWAIIMSVLQQQGHSMVLEVQRETRISCQVRPQDQVTMSTDQP
jgi:hypothetical protein